MTEVEIIDATYWAGFWSRLEHWMFAGVVITLAVEFLALKFAEPHKEKLEQQRELKIAELTKEGQRLSKEAETARSSIAEANARAAEAQLALEKLRTPRSLSVQQQQDISSRLGKWKTVSPTENQRVAIFSTIDDFESLLLCEQLSKVLGPDGAGFVINRNKVTYATPPMAVAGIGILTSQDERGRKVGADIVEALSKNGLQAFMLAVEWKATEGEVLWYNSAVSIMVGEKPKM